MAKRQLISLIKPIEATRINARTGMSLGLPEVTVPYGAFIDHLGDDRDRVKFSYLSELYTCKRDAFLSATAGLQSPPEPTEEAPPESAPEKAPELAAVRLARLEWSQVNSSDYSVSRAAVPGGWLVSLNGASVTFVPDPGRRWNIGAPE